MRWLMVDYGLVVSDEPTAQDRAALAEAAGMEQAAFDAGYWAHRDAYDMGAPSVTYWTRVLGRLPEHAEIARLDELDAACWTHVNGASAAQLRTAKGAGARLALLSNAPEPVAHRIAELDIMQVFEQQFFSCDLGLIKPDPAIYTAVTERLEADPDELVFVDDRQVNVDAAVAAGWRAVVFDRTTGLSPAIDLLQP